MAHPSPDLLPLEAARLFYERGLSKTEIAEHLGISRFRVARLLDQAQDRGLVTVVFHPPPELDVDLATELANLLALPFVVVAKSPAMAHQAAGDLVLDIARPDDVIGIAWGSTLTAVVEALPSRRLPAVQVIQLAGGSRLGTPADDPNMVAAKLAEVLHAELHPIYAPVRLASKILRDGLLAEAGVASTLSWFNRVRIALIGIGTLHPAAQSSLIAAGAISEQERVVFRRQGAVADLVLNLIDDAGRPVPSLLDESTVTISLSQLASIPRVIGVATGRTKAGAILAAARSGVLWALVTDVEAAQSILNRRESRT